jgi:predicted nucleic acid-binding protein
MDERLGRATATRAGLQVTGVLGILVAAKRNNLIQEVKPLLDALIEQVGFWIDESFMQRLCKQLVNRHEIWKQVLSARFFRSLRTLQNQELQSLFTHAMLLQLVA